MDLIEKKFENEIINYNKELKRMWADAYLTAIKYGRTCDGAKLVADTCIKDYQEAFKLYPIVIKYIE